MTLHQLRNGQLVTIQPNLVRRLKSHFVTLPCGVDLILALNGYIWVSKHVKETEQEGEEGFDAEAVYSNRNDVSNLHNFSAPVHFNKLSLVEDIDVATRTAISRVCNIIRVLSAHFVPLTDTILSEAYEWLAQQDGDAKDLMQDDFGHTLVTTVSARRSF